MGFVYFAFMRITEEKELIFNGFDDFIFGDRVCAFG